MDFNSIRGVAICSDDKGHRGAITESLQKHVTMDTDTEEQEAHEAIVWGDSLHRPTGYFTLLWEGWCIRIG